MSGVLDCEDSKLQQIFRCFVVHDFAHMSINLPIEIGKNVQGFA